ncbi:MAG TPA: M48 family metalloprotease [Pyrinomonadaceae bacterium]|jgi:Zn-dependent protease with chaperone function|nr:M48 family metalloprotease [Pyrinomonadaceae bacterium]
MYELLGICLFLATLILLNACASLAATLISRIFAPFAESLSARTRADIFFMLRIAAPGFATVAVVLFLIPSYVSYEPYGSSEIVSKKLVALAFLSAVSVAFVLWRTIRSWTATRTLQKQWLAAAERIHVHGIDIPVFRISHSFPIIAVIGTLRPKLFIADQVLAALSKDELAAAISHECGHLAARDNLKRTLLRICRDSLFLLPLGRAVDSAWAANAERAADEFAARRSPAAALNLASALVRIAKLVPLGARADVPLGAYLVGAEETHGVKERIKRLIEISSNCSPINESTRVMRFFPATVFCVIALVATAAATNAKVLLAVHALAEQTVRLLS